ncbi:hypothetical protein SAMN04488519_10410 [Algoriphagus ornithinivorans]|jgi:hypothetical protein|uniref:Rod shape-determining protein MreD n=1 Tax=Algoriphagus ornithinivorans TaxID=226506 RepID=A0A1I5EPU4_9BACT|nr:rod shape-determining protein MreD [Algoriphagus ornithinivorans]SFO13535.1 hypothetical protein SAMN04488519_10410 [Algoriphagus ornithinivorans]
MNIRTFISFFLMGLILVAVQIFLLKNLALFGVALCFLYLLIILSLPVSIGHIPLILLSFGIGLFIDMFYDTMGIHAASATFIGFIRPYWLKVISPTGGYDDSNEPTLKEMGMGWYFTYAIPMIFFFSLIFFSIDQWGTGGFFGVLNKSFFSSTLTFLLAILVQLLFFKKRRGI